MIALDTNVLLHARRMELPHHRLAKKLLLRLASGNDPWAIPWPCVYEFVRVVTHPRVFDPPTELERVVDDLTHLFECPSLRLLGEGPAHAGHFRRSILSGKAVANLAHDAHIAALCIEHGVNEIWTLDRDFARFPGIQPVDPFAGKR